MNIQKIYFSLLVVTIFILLKISSFSYAQENCASIEERTGVSTMKGKPIVLLGHEVKVGQKAPDFVVQANDMSDARLSDFSGKIKLIASVPSLDTKVCDLEIRHFNQEASSLSPDIKILFISMDLPFAQKRFCSAADIKNVKAFSDHRTADLGINYGVLIKDMRLLSRAIFIIDKNDTVRYVQYVHEQGTQPDYEAALKILKSLL